MSHPSVSSEPRPAWVETFLSLEHDEAGERRGIACFVRPDLGACLTAQVSPLADGRWSARLFTSPDASYTITRSHQRVAERLASEHSDRLTAETFFADSVPDAAQ